LAFNSVWLGYDGYPSLVQAYLNSPWSAAARAMRGANADFTLVNYATFFFTVPNPFNGGIPGPFIITQPSAACHSEKQVWIAIRGVQSLNRFSIPNWMVGQGNAAGLARLTPAQAQALDGTVIHAVYTERQPCGTCSPFLNDILLDNTPVFWHFPYPSQETSKHKHDDNDIVVNGLMAMSRDKTYGQSMKDHTREGRVEGNKDLRSAMKYIGKQQAGQYPTLMATMVNMDTSD
jgi:hypothetical protein